MPRPGDASPCPRRLAPPSPLAGRLPRYRRGDLHETPAGGRKALALILKPEDAWLEAQAGTLLGRSYRPQPGDSSRHRRGPAGAMDLSGQTAAAAANGPPGGICPVSGLRQPADGLGYSHGWPGERSPLSALRALRFGMAYGACPSAASAATAEASAITASKTAEAVSAEACPACRSYSRSSTRTEIPDRSAG